MPSSRPFWPILIGLLGALVGMALSSPLADTSAISPSSDATGGGGTISPDPRWLALIRGQSASGIRLQAANPSLHVHLTDRVVAGRVPSPAPVSVRVSRDDAVLISTTVQPIPEGEGYFYIAALPPWGAGTWAYGYCGEPFLPGDVFWAVQGNTVLSLTLPPLSALADPEADLVSGAAPPSDTLSLYLYPRAAPDAVLTQTVVAGPEGVYQAGWADLRPGDTGFVAWNEAPNRAAYLRFVAPLLQVQVDGAEVVGMAPPCTGIVMEVADGVGNRLLAHQTTAGRDGRFQTWLWWAEKEEGLPRLLPGYRVQAGAAGQTFSTTVLPVTARTDRAGGQVLGEAPPGAPVRVEVAHGPIAWSWESIVQRPPHTSAWVTATAQGHYTATVPLAPADYGAAFAVGPDGHETFARFAVPHLRVILGRERYGYESRLWGQVDGSNVPLTLSLQGPTGILKDVRLLRVAGSGFFYDLLRDTDPVLESGDVLTVETPRGVQAALALPTLTAQVDTFSETVFGLAPPGARVTVTLNIWGSEKPAGPAGGPTPPPPPPPTQVSQVVTAGADGTYVADFRGVADLTHRSTGEVSLTAPEGHIVIRPFRAQDCRPVLTAVSVGGNHVSGVSSQGCPSATVRLVNPAGALKAQAFADFSWWDQFTFYFYLYGACPVPDWCEGKSYPVLILPGDRIEVESGGAVYTTTVPTLTLEVDRETPALSGWAPPGETLGGEIRGDAHEIRHAFTTTVAPDGRYTVPLTGIYTPTAGESISVWWQPGETRFYAHDVLPRLRAGLFQNALYGLLHPLIPYTVTPGAITGRAGPDGEFAASMGPLLPGETVTVTTPREELSLTLSLLTARIDRATATVFGQAPPNGPLEVSLSAYPLYLFRQVTATAAGTYTVSFPEAAPLLAGAWGTVRYTNPQGHLVFLQFGMRTWLVTLGERCADGYADMAGAPFTATLETADGFTETVTGTASSYNANFSLCFSVPLESGDRLTLTQASGETALVLPRLTASHDWAAQVLEGQAPPGSLVEAAFPRGWTTLSRRTVADGTGRYRLDTRDLGLRLGDSGLVRVADAEGNIIRRPFRVQGYRMYLPVVSRE
ncbi:MAG: hypothetical protein H5T61_08245 [Thermoflexales bacterium]|nr:hypothetical protein [Thermoflexales bacterium]